MQVYIMPQSFTDMQTALVHLITNSLLREVATVHFDTIKPQMVTAYVCYTTVTQTPAKWSIWKIYQKKSRFYINTGFNSYDS